MSIEDKNLHERLKAVGHRAERVVVEGRFKGMRVLNSKNEQIHNSPVMNPNSCDDYLRSIGA